MNRIALIPIGSIDDEVLGNLQEGLDRAFRLGVEIGSPLEHPHYAYDFKRKQYSPRAILAALRAIGVNEDERILGVTDSDLQGPKLGSVLGEADAEHGVALISLWRMRQVYRALPGQKKLFAERAIKESIHLLGHTYGLGHCWAPRCVMYPSNRLKDTDTKQSVFCHECYRKLEGKGIIR